tara:strand:- start:80 stop:307 length:228 start_codon:yes stop_codon:yes gene_type:complete
MKNMISLNKRQLKNLEAIRTKHQMTRRDIIEKITQNPDDTITNNDLRQVVLNINKDIQRVDASIRYTKQTINSLK